MYVFIYIDVRFFIKSIKQKDRLFLILNITRKGDCGFVSRHQMTAVIDFSSSIPVSITQGWPCINIHTQKNTCLKWISNEMLKQCHPPLAIRRTIYHREIWAVTETSIDSYKNGFHRFTIITSLSASKHANLHKEWQFKRWKGWASSTKIFSRPSHALKGTTPGTGGAT